MTTTQVSTNQPIKPVNGGVAEPTMIDAALVTFKDKLAHKE